MKLIAPANFVIYKGATISSIYAGDTVLFWACQAWYPDKRFGTAVFKQVGEKPSVLAMELPIFCNGRGSISLDGRVTAFDEVTGIPYTFAIPGFHPIIPGTAVPVNVPISTGVVDTAARANASQALSQAANALKKAEQAFAQSATAMQTANTKPTLDQVWQKALDAIEATIINAEKDRNHHLARFVWQKSIDATFGFLRDRGIIKN